jgi:hypothetical protein
MSGLAVFWSTDEVWQGNERSGVVRGSSDNGTSSSDDDELAAAFAYYAMPLTKKKRRGAQPEGKTVVARTAPGPSFDFAAFFAQHPTTLISHLRRELRREWRYAALRCERLEALLETHGIPLPKRLRGVRLRRAQHRSTAAGVQAALADATAGGRDAVAANALRVAIEVAHAQHLPVSAFLFGVCSTLIKVFLFGAYPRALAAYFFVEFPVLCVVVVRTLRQQRMLIYLAEFCWVANAFGWCALALELAHASGAPFFPVHVHLSGAARIGVARTFFAIANGPLSLSIITNKNVLVFHDAVRTSGLFIHLGPAVASWALRWYGAGDTPWVVEDAGAAGDGESIGHLSGELITNLYLHPLCAYAAWWIVYGAWLLAWGFRRKSYPPRLWARSTFGEARGAFFREHCPGLAPGGRAQALAYLLLHAASVSAGLLLPMALYQSWALHSLYIACLLGVALTNGAKFYRFGWGRRMAATIVREIEAANALGQVAGLRDECSGARPPPPSAPRLSSKLVPPPRGPRPNIFADARTSPLRHHTQQSLVAPPGSPLLRRRPNTSEVSSPHTPARAQSRWRRPWLGAAPKAQRSSLEMY